MDSLRTANTGCKIAEIPAGKPWDKTPEMEAFARFVASLEARFAERMHKGRLRFTADVAADPECATFLYEIVRL